MEYSADRLNYFEASGISERGNAGGRSGAGSDQARTIRFENAHCGPGDGSTGSRVRDRDDDPVFGDAAFVRRGAYDKPRKIERLNDVENVAYVGGSQTE